MVQVKKVQRNPVRRQAVKVPVDAETVSVGPAIRPGWFWCAPIVLAAIVLFTLLLVEYQESFRVHDA